MAILTKWALPPGPPMFGVARITRLWQRRLYFSRTSIPSIYQLDMTGPVHRMREWPIPPALQGATAYHTWVEGLTLGPGGRPWACWAQYAGGGLLPGGRLLQLDPARDELVVFYDLPKAPYATMHDLSVDGHGRVWYAVTSAATGAGVGVFDPDTQEATYWELPPECERPQAIWVDQGA